MPAVLLGLLTSPKAWAALGVGLLLAIAGIQTARLNHAKGDLAGARAAQVDPATKKTWQAEAVLAAQDRDSCKMSLSSADAALTAQNAGVAALKADGDKRTAAAAAGLRAAQSATQAAQALAAATLATKPGPDACKSADDVILRTLR